MMSILKCERETVILFNEEDKNADVYTYHKPLIKKLDNLCKESKAVCINLDESGSRRYLVPKNWIKVSPPKKMKLTPEQRQDIANRLNKDKLL
jgi:hypothetical protein